MSGGDMLLSNGARRKHASAGGEIQVFVNTVRKLGGVAIDAPDCGEFQLYAAAYVRAIIWRQGCPRSGWSLRCHIDDELAKGIVRKYNRNEDPIPPLYPEEVRTAWNRLLDKHLSDLLKSRRDAYPNAARGIRDAVLDAGELPRDINGSWWTYHLDRYRKETEKNTTTTSYGSWNSASGRRSLSLEQEISEALGVWDESLTDAQVSAVAGEWRARINAALPPCVQLCGDEFYGPPHPEDDEFGGYPHDDAGRLDIEAIIDQVDGDFWAYVEQTCGGEL